MQIKAVKFRRDGFYGQPFAFGGEDLPDDWKCPRRNFSLSISSGIW